MKKFILVCITIFTLNIIYNNIDASSILNELYNSLLHQDTQTNKLYVTANNIIDININIQYQHLNKLLYNTDNIIINNKIHYKSIYSTIISIFCMISLTSIYLKIKTILYEHEMYKIIHTMHICMLSILVIIIYYTEILTNTIIKKNFNSTEVLYVATYNITITQYVINILPLLIYYIFTQKKESLHRTTKSKIQTKYIISTLYSILINIYAQYSINESIIIVLYAEILYQTLSTYKNIVNVRTK